MTKKSTGAGGASGASGASGAVVVERNGWLSLGGWKKLRSSRSEQSTKLCWAGCSRRGAGR